MDNIGELKNLMDRLEETETQKQNAEAKLKDIINRSLENIKDIYFTLKKYVWKDKISLRSYSGKLYELGEGIIIRDRGIEEKIILKPDRKIILYTLADGKVSETQLDAQNIEDYITMDNIFADVMSTITSSIQKNEKEVLLYNSMITKIERYMQDLKNVISSQDTTNK